MFKALISVVSILVPVLGLMNNAQAVGPTADTYVRGSGNTDNNYSTEGNIVIKNTNGGSTDRKGYIRFEVASGIADASLELTVTINNEGGGGTTPQVFTVEVYGLAESLDHTWVESEITWNNAPANSLSDHNFTADATYLGSFLVDQTPAGGIVTFSDPALADFINDDTDNQMTLLFRRTSGNGSHNLGFASKEHANYSPVTLTVRAASQAFRPSPANEATDIPWNVILGWTPGQFAPSVNGHIVYLSDNFRDVNDGMGGIPQDANSFEPTTRLDFGTTYYWRVDEVNGAPDYTVFKGDIWNFTVEPYSIMIPVDVNHVTASSSAEVNPPSLTVDGSGLDGTTHTSDSDAMWLSAATDLSPWLMVEFDQVQKLDKMLVWNSNSTSEGFVGWGIKDVTIECSIDGADWTVISQASQVARAPGQPTYDAPQAIDLGRALAKYVRINILSNWGGLLKQYGVSEIRFYGLPVYARTPNPTSGSTDVLPDAVVTWRAGREADQHTIYMSADAEAVASGSAPSVQASTNQVAIDSLGAQLGETYYWRVDEVNDAESMSVWEGPVWSLSTATFFVVEDFESYGNLSPDRPFQTWLDGYGYSADEFFTVAYGGNGTGAGIGHDIWNPGSPQFDGSIMETGNTMAGSSQSMPFYYSNIGGTASETERTFAVPQDWTAGGVKTLSIAFAGQVGNTGALYVKINDTKVTYNGDPANLALTVWQAWNIDLTAVNTNLQNVTKLAMGVEGSGASGMLLIDDIRLHPQAGQKIMPVDPGTLNLVGAWSLDEGSGSTTADSSGHGHTGTIVDATWDTGIQGSALLFSETGYVDTGFAGVTGTASRTSTAWIKTTEANRTFVSWGLNTTGRKWRIRLDVTGGLRAEINGAYHYGKTYLADDEWHHTAVVLEDDGTPNAAEILLYVDGLPETTAAVTSTAIDTDPTGVFRIGMATYDTVGFIGLIDEVRLYDRALSDGEVLSLAGRTTPVDKPF
ncbi:MAG: DNRLRE domain-containing protein [Phycisphaerae bacterium]|nr:DNRLRE domain-containing protein [Phycisphaerae bacterium]